MRWGDQLYPSLPFHPGYPLEDGYVHTLVSTQESESVSTRNSSIVSTRRQDINLINLLDLYIHTSLHATGWISYSRSSLRILRTSHFAIRPRTPRISINGSDNPRESGVHIVVGTDGAVALGIHRVYLSKVDM